LCNSQIQFFERGGLHVGFYPNSNRFPGNPDEAYAHSEVAVPIAIIINELVTNTIKYGFPDERAGQVLIRLRSTGDELVISVSDNGVGMPEPEQTRKGFGSKVVALLVQQLDGELCTRMQSRAAVWCCG
jgi:two-component sensor histidine kinase